MNNGKSQTVKGTRSLANKIDHRPIWEQAYAILRAQILDGQLAPGTPLNLRELAKQLAISVTPIRDALLRLESEGLVEGNESRGLRVTQLSEMDIKQTLELRTLLEVYALEQSAPLLTEKDLDRLEDLLNSESPMIQEPDEQKARLYTELGREFHHFLVAAADNRSLLDLYDRLHTFVVMERAQRGFRTDHLLEDHKEHVAILQALRRRNYADAIELLKAHLERIKSFTLEGYLCQ